MLPPTPCREHTLPLPCHACVRYVFLTVPCVRKLAATTPLPPVPVPSPRHPQHPHPHVEPVGYPSFPFGVGMEPAVLREGPPLWSSPDLPAALGSCVRARSELVSLTSQSPHSDHQHHLQTLRHSSTLTQARHFLCSDMLCLQAPITQPMISRLPGWPGRL